jgi:hypothetical protein
MRKGQRVKSRKITATARTATVAAVAGILALGMAGPAAAASGHMYGDPTAAAKYWRHQQYDDCVLMSSADVVGLMTGREPSEESIINKAQSTPSVMHPGSIYFKPANNKNPNSGNGTSVLDIPTLLGQYGVKAVTTDNDDVARTHGATGMAALEQHLSGGHKVIVSLNAELLWHEPVDENKKKNGSPRADHAVVVTGIDTANNVVHLNDSGTKTGRDEQVPMDLFVRSWGSSDDLMVVTA